VGFAAGAGPVVARIGEAVERSGEAVIELSEGFHFLKADEVEFAGKDFVFLNDLVFEAFHEAGHVDSVVPITEAERAGGEIAGRGEGDGDFDFGVNLGTLLAEVFEDDITAKAEADEGKFLVAF